MICIFIKYQVRSDIERIKDEDFFTERARDTEKMVSN